MRVTNKKNYNLNPNFHERVVFIFLKKNIIRLYTSLLNFDRKITYRNL
jgi:hypothetical protein